MSVSPTSPTSPTESETIGSAEPYLTPRDEMYALYRGTGYTPGRASAICGDDIAEAYRLSSMREVSFMVKARIRHWARLHAQGLITHD